MLKPKNNKISTIFDKESNLEWKDDFYFIVGADTQYGQFERLGLVDRNKLPEGKKAWYKELELSEKAVSLVNQLEPKPKFMIICGDMLDAFTYKLVPDIQDRVFTDQLDPERDEQYEDFMRVFGKLTDIPLICVCGNHDVGDAPEVKLLDGYRKQFGDDYFAFYFNGVMFICLNSMYYFQSQFCEEQAKEQDEWLDKILLTEAKRFQHVLVFVHMPPFVVHIDEPNTFLNMDKYKRKVLLHKLRHYGVKKIFAGHLHQNKIGYYKDFECVITSAIGMQNGPASNSGFRAVKVNKYEITHEYYTFNDCPKKLDL